MIQLPKILYPKYTTLVNAPENSLKFSFTFSLNTLYTSIVKSKNSEVKYSAPDKVLN